MKLRVLLFSLAVLAVLIMVMGCSKEGAEPEEPELSNPMGSSLIDLPNCISNPDSILATRMLMRSIAIDDDSVTGDEIYENVRAYIGVAHFCRNLVAEMMNELAPFTTDFSGTFEDEEGHTYTISFITGEVAVNGETYGYNLNLWDPTNEKVLEFYFQRAPNTKGILIFRPYMIHPDTVVDWAEDFYAQIVFDLTKPGYDKWMEISLAGFPYEELGEGTLNNLKLEVYLVGDKISLRGNSNHPQVSLTHNPAETPVDRNYIFRGMADTTLNLGICEVGLPTSDVITTDNIFIDYAVPTVFDSLITLCYPTVPESLVAEWVATFEAPGFFTEEGFLQPGPDLPDEPTGFDALLEYTELDCYIPAEIRDLTIEFIDDSPPTF